MSTFGFNIIGAVSANLGIGVSLRHLVRLLVDCGYPVAILERLAGLSRDGHDETWRHLRVDAPADLPYAVNLVVQGLPWVGPSLLKPDTVLQEVLRPDRLNVGLFWWELPTVPRRWVEAARCFDALLCPSAFIRYNYAACISGPVLIGMHHPCHVPEPDPSLSRDALGLPRDGLIFLSSLEPSSGRARKNPVGVLRAFREAFPDTTRRDVHLVFKLNNSDTGRDPGALALLAELREARAIDPRIHVITRTLSYAEVMALHACADVFVSLHRAEGLGLAPLEAMHLGRCVMATGWSGNMDYMDQESACLVDYTLVPTSDDQWYEPAYLGERAWWAEPDGAHAAHWMRRLAADPDLRARKGAAARAAALRFQATAARADFVHELQAVVAERALRPEVESRYLDTRALAEAEQQHAARHGQQRSGGGLKALFDRHLGWRFRRPRS